jgi:hypothetical protein
MTPHPPVDRIEYYVRGVSKRTGTAGVFEPALESAREAAGQFADDPDAVSAMKVAISPKGRPVAMSDATDEVREALIEMVWEGDYESCPHPMIEDVFDEIIAEKEQNARDEEDHIRIERAMLQI